MDYKKRLYDLRTDNDLKQTDIAAVLKITGQAYGMYENGKRGLPIEHLITLCRYYGVSSDYILGLTDCKTPRRTQKHRPVTTYGCRSVVCFIWVRLGAL